MTTPHPDAPGLREAVDALRWYHTMELAPGVVTPGWFDTRVVAPLMPWPQDMAGLRCLDIGTFDGFWAFEMERRGAAEVQAIDILDEDRWDWPPRVDPMTRSETEAMKEGNGFQIAKDAHGSAVERKDCSIYDLDPDVHGTFDVVFIGSLLLHLRDPVLALTRVAKVTRGRLVLSDGIDLLASIMHPHKPVFNLDGMGRPYWWRPSVAGLRRIVRVAGFRPVTRLRPFMMPPGPGHPRLTWSDGLRFRDGRELLFTRRFGDPHACIAAVPDL